MSTALQTIQEKAPQLSPEKQIEAARFIEALLNEEPPSVRSSLQFDWIDGPDAPPMPYSSVELQHLAARWRERNALASEDDDELTFDWVDDPHAAPDPLTSVEAQHLASQWWIEDELKRQ